MRTPAGTASPLTGTPLKANRGSAQPQGLNAPLRPEDQILTTRVGLHFPDVLTFDRWQDAGRHIARIVDTSAWCLGDWLVYGQSHYSDRYRHAIDAVGLDYQTLRNYAWVARRYPAERRREGLSFQHHAEVAALPPEEQDRWLNRAAEEGWSKTELRKHVRSDRQRRNSPDLPTFLTLGRIAPDRATQWMEAAAQSQRPLEQWVMQTLDFAAEQALRRL